MPLGNHSISCLMKGLLFPPAPAAGSISTLPRRQRGSTTAESGCLCLHLAVYNEAMVSIPYYSVSIISCTHDASLGAMFDIC